MIRLRNTEFLAATNGANAQAMAALNAWQTTVLTNGGSLPTGDIITILTTFYAGLVSDGLVSKMLLLMAMPPPSVNFVGATTTAQDRAALTPLIQTVGVNPVRSSQTLNSNNLTKDGYIGQPGNNFSLDPQIDITTAFANDNSAGITAYSITGDDSATTGQGHGDFGCFSGLSPNCEFGLWINGGNVAQYACWTNTGGGIVSASYPTANFKGYISGNRTASNDLRLYFANSVNPHAQLGSTVTTAGGSRIGSGISTGLFNKPFILSENFQNYNGIPTAHSAKRLSFFALHLGLTSSDSSKLYSRVQTMRQSFGGGFA